MIQIMFLQQTLLRNFCKLSAVMLNFPEKKIIQHFCYSMILLWYYHWFLLSLIEYQATEEGMAWHGKTDNTA